MSLYQSPAMLHLWFKRRFVIVFHLSKWEQMTPWSGQPEWANFDTMGLAGRIYVGDHWTLLHTKYIRCRGPLDIATCKIYKMSAL